MGSTSKEVEEELTTGKQLTRVFNGPNHVEEHTDDIAMINTINFDDLLLGEAASHSTSTAPMDMIEEEVENLTIEQKNIQLQAVLKDMEKEVASYKKRILEQVSGVRT